jgi:hypothetical protein
MVSISQINFNTDGWQLTETSSSVIKWQNDIPDGMSLNFFDLEPDIPASLNNVSVLQEKLWLEMKAQGVGLVSLEIVDIAGVSALKQIVKIPIPNQSNGLIYLASFTIPFALFSYVIKFQCQEWGPTGVRDSIIGNQALAAGQIKLGSGNGKIQGWTPYLNSDMNLAEKEEYDAMFLQHPLSRARRYLKNTQASIRIDTELMHVPKFIPPS